MAKTLLRHGYRHGNLREALVAAARRRVQTSLPPKPGEPHPLAGLQLRVLFPR
jgi:hypothetical protein